jgi:hypothetical protein
MDTYDFYAVSNFDGGSIRDRYKLDAESFPDACAQAQQMEPDTVYDEFVRLKS